MSNAVVAASGKGSNANSATNNADSFFYLSALAEIGIQAKLRDGRIVLAPKERITPKVKSVITEKRKDIIAELHAYAELMASQQKQTSRSEMPTGIWSRYADSRHDLDACEAAWSELYLACARFKIPAWWGADREAEPIRPYGYIKDELVDGQWFYRTMLADVDGMDYIWSLD